MQFLAHLNLLYKANDVWYPANNNSKLGSANLIDGELKSMPNHDSRKMGAPINGLGADIVVNLNTDLLIN
jgi:hypothetical protein